MNKKAFSLIELIVGISISMLLMVSVGIFVSTGMHNIFMQQKTLENTDNFSDFAENLNTSFSLIQSGSFIPTITSSGILIKKGQNFGDGGFSYIGTESLSGVYCDSDSESSETNSLFIKNFIPFEENGEDIFTNYNDILTSKEITIGIKKYKSIQKEHKIIDENNDIIIGKGIFGDKFQNGEFGTGIYLNSPTGLASSGSILFISDTLNNRILYYDTNSKKINLLLDETDGLNEPTGLYYNDSSLYIANSGNGEILKYSSKSTALAPTLTMSGFTINDVNKIEISFSGSNIINLIGPTSTGSFILTPNSSNSDYLTGTINKLQYYSITYGGINNETECNGKTNGDIIFDGNKPKIYCTQSGSGKTASYPNITNLSKIEINDLSDFSNTGTYYVNLKLFEDITEKYTQYFPYFTQSDDNLITKNDNILEVVRTGLNYPTGIWNDGGIKYNEFGKVGRVYNNLEYSDKDILLKTPIKSLDITKNNDLLNLVLKYYKSYNCYNLDEKVERTFLLKKNLK